MFVSRWPSRCTRARPWTFVLSCKGFRDAMKQVLQARTNTETTETWLKTSRSHYGKKDEIVPISEDWIKWASSMKWEYARSKVEENNEGYKSDFLTYLAARGGFKKDVLVWLKSQGCVPNAYATYAAAQGGNIRFLEYLKSEGLAFHSRACSYAAEGGHIHVLKYLKSEGVTL